MQSYLNTSDQGVHRLSAAELLEAEWDLPGAQDEGTRRRIARGMLGSGASLAVGIMPAGQGSPVHASSGEHLLLGLEGTITWSVTGHEPVVMGPMDLVFIGAGLDYSYRNTGDSEAKFVDVIGRVDAWPHTANYLSPDGSTVQVGHE